MAGKPKRSTTATYLHVSDPREDDRMRLVLIDWAHGIAVASTFDICWNVRFHWRRRSQNLICGSLKSEEAGRDRSRRHRNWSLMWTFHARSDYDAARDHYCVDIDWAAIPWSIMTSRVAQCRSTTWDSWGLRQRSSPISGEKERFRDTTLETF